MKTDFRLELALPLGIRNNNPGNIRPSKKYTWEHAVGENKGFVVFDDVRYGIRALAIDLINKQRRGLDTVSKIISTYAPPTENLTNNYIASVCSLISGKAEFPCYPDTILPKNIATLHLLIMAICRHENGETAALVVPYINAGIDLVPEDRKIFT
jgi:hypothetical protein